MNSWQTNAIVLVLFIVWSVLMFGSGSHYTSIKAELAAATEHNEQWAKTFTLNAQLATRDVQLAKAQEQLSIERTERVKKTGGKYAAEISKPAVRDCIKSSGLLDHYNATIRTK